MYFHYSLITALTDGITHANIVYPVKVMFHFLGYLVQRIGDRYGIEVSHILNRNWTLYYIAIPALASAGKLKATSY